MKMTDGLNYWQTIFGLLNQIENALALDGFDVRALPNSGSAVGMRVSARVCDVTAEALVLLVDKGDGLFIYYTTGGDGEEIATTYPESAEQIRGLVRRVVDSVKGSLWEWKRLFQDGVIAYVAPKTKE